MFRTEVSTGLFERQGFFVGFRSRAHIGYVRANIQLGLFELVQLDAGKPSGGRWGDISNATIRIGLTPGELTCVKGIAEAECLSDWTPTKSTEDAAAWEEQVAVTAPGRLTALVESRSAALLARTESARRAVAMYLSYLPPGDILAATRVLTRDATEPQRKEAARLSATTGMICLPERHAYDLVSILIATHCSLIDDEERYWGQCPTTTPDLNWRIQIMASKLFPERGWEMMQ